MNQDKFNLNWNTYTDHLMEMLHNMMSSNELADVTLVSEDKKIFKAHKVVLSACSSVFKSIITDSNLSTSPIIYLRGIQSLEIESILQFFYLGQATFYQERMIEFIDVAHSLDVKDISKDIKIPINEQYYDAGKQYSDNEKELPETESMHEEMQVNSPQNEFIDVAHSFDVNNISKNIEIPNNEQYYDAEKQYSDNEKEFPETESMHEEIQVNTPQNEFIDVAHSLDVNIISKNIEIPNNKQHYDAEKQHSENETDSMHEIGVDTPRRQSKSLQNNQSKYPCDQCHQKYSSSRNLQHHIESVHDKIKYPCSKCNFKATLKSYLNLHIKSIHDGVKYPCNQCNFKASHSSHLRQHILSIHNGVKYTCNQCNYTAKYRENLHQHIKSVHNGIRYPCNQCNYKATTTFDLKRHIKSVHDKINKN